MALTIISLIKQVPLPGEMRMGEDGLMDRTKANRLLILIANLVWKPDCSSKNNILTQN